MRILALDLGTRTGDISKRLPGQLVPSPLTGTVSEGDLAYLAGLFDGEGCVQIRKRGRRWECALRLVGTNLPLMRWAADLTGGSLAKRKPGGTSVRRSFEVCIQHSLAERWAALLRPFLRIKADEVDLLLEFRRLIRANGKQHLTRATEEPRFALVATCRALKRRAF